MLTHKSLRLQHTRRNAIMKRHLFLLREVCQGLFIGFSYSTLSVCVTLFVCVVLVIGCGPAPKGQYHVPETALAAAAKTAPEQSMETGERLPDAASVDVRELPYVRNVFKESPRISQGGLDDFYATTRGTTQHIAIVSNISFDVLKAFIVEGWVPIVMVPLQGRSPEILPLSAYNDSVREAFLQNPVDFGERRVSYKDFEVYWAASSRNKCVLITPQLLTEASVREMLGKYLPAEAFQRIRVRSR